MKETEAPPYRKYSAKQLDRRIRLEDGIDDRLDKMLARLTVLQEARALWEKLSKSNDPTRTPAAKSLENFSNEASISHELEVDLDADDNETSTPRHPGERPLGRIAGRTGR